MRAKMLRAGRDQALLWLVVTLIGLPVARAADGVPDCSDAVVAEIQVLCPSPGSVFSLATQSSGAEALLCMPPPEAWNGDLIAFARGNTLFPPPPGVQGGDCKLAGMLGQLDVDDTSLPQLANELGFGFATTSCSEDVIALEECKADLVNLVDNFQDFLDALEVQNGVDYDDFVGQAYIAGASFGGLVATQLIEEEEDLDLVATEVGPDLFAGGLAACGPIGSFARLIRYQGDVLVLVDFLYRDELALVFPDEGKPQVDSAIPLDDPVAFAGFCRDLEEIIDGNPDAGEKLQRVMAAAREPIATDPSGETTLGESVADLLCGDALPVILFSERAFGGNPYGNQRRFYFDPKASLLENIELNRGIDRFEADATTDAFETAGRLRNPLVAIHNVLDPRVPFSQLRRYAFKVLLRGSFANFTPIPAPTTRFGHCAFAPEEILLALAALFFQVEGFDLPGVAALLEDPEALIRFDERLVRLR